MNQDDFLLKRNKWLEEVVEKCHEFALKLDIDFYVFQTPCDIYNPDLLIIGINPGGGKGYKKMLENEQLEKRPIESLLYSVNTLTTKPYWEIERNEKGADFMRSRMNSVFTKENGLNKTLEKAVMMNMCYFNTEDESLLNKTISKEVQDFCADKTLEFIEILNPKNILIISSSIKNIRKLKVRGEITQIGRFLKSGFINDRLLFAIPHYAARTSAYSKTEGTNLGVELKSQFIIL
jgi:hypothetical protein